MAVPDGGVAAGHGADTARPARVRVPERDATPPLALLRLEPGGRRAPPSCTAPPCARAARPAVALARPEVRATALIRDPDGGTGRIRLTVELRRHAAQASAAAAPSTSRRRRSSASGSRPGPRVPGASAAAAASALPAGCRVAGKAFADATNALGLESFSDPVRFVYG